MLRLCMQSCRNNKFNVDVDTTDVKNMDTQKFLPHQYETYNNTRIQTLRINQPLSGWWQGNVMKNGSRKKNHLWDMLAGFKLFLNLMNSWHADVSGPLCGNFHCLITGQLQILCFSLGSFLPYIKNDLWIGILHQSNMDSACSSLQMGQRVDRNWKKFFSRKWHKCVSSVLGLQSQMSRII